MGLNKYIHTIPCWLGENVVRGSAKTAEKRLAYLHGQMVNSFVILSRTGALQKNSVTKTCRCRLFSESQPLLQAIHPVTSAPYSIIETTDDALFAGRLICRQPRDGYRFSVDAVLVAHFTAPKAGQRVLDLGCGCGVVGLVMAYRHPRISVCGLELQPDLAALAETNVRDNGYEQRCTVQQGDIRSLAALLVPESYDMVVTNPPYRKTATGRLNRDAQAAHARHELQGGIEDFVRAAAFAVRNRGKVVCIYPARRCSILMAALHNQRLTPKRLQPIYSYPGTASACLVLVEAVKNGGEQMDLLAPLYIYERRNGPYTPAMQALYEEDGCLPR
jgi:tRNA1(Val) A37 N6-methylase TrmN6